jgi:hypothetical protein
VRWPNYMPKFVWRCKTAALHKAEPQSRTVFTVRLDTPSALLFRPPSRQMALALRVGPRHRLVAIREDPGVEQLPIPQHSRLHAIGTNATSQVASFSLSVRVQSVVGEGSKGNGTLHRYATYELLHSIRIQPPTVLPLWMEVAVAILVRLKSRAPPSQL